MKFLVIIFTLILTISAFGQTKMTDREAKGLKGKVKSVTISGEKIESKNYFDNTLGKIPDRIEKYFLDGTQTASIDYQTNRNNIYTVIDGDLTVKYGEIDDRPQNEGFRVAPLNKKPQQPTQPKDERYDLKYKFKFDDKGRRIELAFYGNTGLNLGKIEYKYDDKGRLVEELRYNEPGESGKAELNNQFIYKYDASGNLVEETETLHRPNKNSIRTRIYTNYKIDSQGNWIERTMTSSQEYNGKELRVVYKYSRKIEYYK